ncbi:MAG: efflux RND transporter permease subunit [Rubricoccaceae bacterium]
MFHKLRFIPAFCARHPVFVLAVAFALSILGLVQAASLRINADLAALLPEEYESVQSLLRLQEAVGAGSTVDVAITSPSFEQNVAFAEDYIARAMQLRTSRGEPVFSDVEFRRDVQFLLDNALYFATYEELDRLEAFLRQQAQSARAISDPLRVDLLRGTRREPAADVEQLREDLAQLALTEYLTSPDSAVLAIRFYPTGSQTDLAYIDRTYAQLDSLAIALRPGMYHPEMTVVAAGRLLRQSVEVRAITDDVRNSFGAGVMAVILAVVLYFLYKSTQARTGGRFVLRVVLSELLRTPVTAVLLSTPLLISLIWAAGVASLAFGTLNLMTSTLGLVLFGLGIDYGIHFYARYAEERGAGRGVEEAITETFVSTGQAIAVSACTTACALFILTLADFRGFSEFGVIGGAGILFAMASMLVVLPAMLSLAEQYKLLNLSVRGEASPYESERRFPFSRTVLGLCLAVTAACVYLAPRAAFEYDFSRLEPEYEAYDRRAAALEPVFATGSRRNPAYLLLDSPEDVRYVTGALKRLAERDSLILAVESLQERFPTDSAGAYRKLDRLAQLRAVLQDPFLQADTTGQVAQLLRAASVTEPIPLDSVPDFVTQPFTTQDGEIGNFVIVFPRGSLGDARRSLRFAELIGEVTTPSGAVYYAASTQLVAADMLRLMQQESSLMIGGTFLIVFLLVWVTFGSLKWTLIAVGPLVCGILWMLGAMVIGGVMLTFYNLVVLPTVLGIGNDGGVHIAHRYREEGKGSIRRVLRSTGEHITVGAMTNLIGFAGLLLSGHPGLRSIGVLAIVGIGTTLAASLIFFPALLQVLEDAGWLDPRRPRPKRSFDLGDRAWLRRPTFRLSARPADPADTPAS